MDNQKKKLNLFMCVMTGVGCVIGSGIFGSLPAEVNAIGSNVILALILATVFETAVMVPIMYAATVLPTNGGFYVMSAKLIHPWAGIAVFVSALMQPVMLSMYAVIFSDYFCQLVPLLADKKELVGLVMLLVFCVLAYFGNYVFASINSIAVFALIAVIALYIFFGLSGITADEVNVRIALNDGIKMNSLAVAINVFSTCLCGASNLSQIPEDIKNPRRNIPLSIVISTVGVSVIYILMSIVTLKYLGNNEISTLSEVARTFMPSSLIVVFVICGPIFGILTTITPVIMACCKQLQVMAEDNLLPHVFTKLNKHGVAYVCLTYLTVVSCIFVATGASFDLLISVMSTLVTLINVPICIFPFAINRKYPNATNHPGFKINIKFVEIMSLAVCIVSIYLAFETLRSLGIQVWGAMLVFTIIVVVYIKIRKRYLSTKGIDLMKKLAEPLKEWEEYEEECRKLDFEKE